MGEQYQRQVEVITQMCLDEGMTEPLTKSRARKVLAENEKEEAGAFLSSYSCSFPSNPPPPPPQPERPNAGLSFSTSDNTYRRRSSRRARESTASNASASSHHGFNTRSAAPSTLSGPGTVSSTNAKVVRKEKWQGGYYAYVEEDWDPAIDGAGVGTGLGTGCSLAASSPPANVRLLLPLFYLVSSILSRMTPHLFAAWQLRAIQNFLQTQ